MIRMLSFFVMMSLSFSAIAAQISGFFTNFSGQYSLTTIDQGKKITLRAFNTQTTADLSRLKTGDLLSASGEYSGDVFVVTHVDFVGLRELLGVWLSGNNIMNFQSFTNVTAHLINLDKPVSVSMTYSLSPGETNSWRIYFSDKNDIILGTITIKKNTAALQFVDTETGEMSKVIELKKIQGYQ